MTEVDDGGATWAHDACEADEAHRAERGVSVIALVLLLVAAAPNEAAVRAEKHFAAGEYEAAIEALEQA